MGQQREDGLIILRNCNDRTTEKKKRTNHRNRQHTRIHIRHEIKSEIVNFLDIT